MVADNKYHKKRLTNLAEYIVILNRQVSSFLRPLFEQLPAIPLDLYRIISGVLLVAFYLDLAKSSQYQLVFWDLIDNRSDQTRSLGATIHLFLIRLLQNEMIVVWTIAGALSICVLIGCCARICALLLYIISISAFRTLDSATDFDNYYMCLLCFWLGLMPIGRTLKLSQTFTRSKADFLRSLDITLNSAEIRLFLMSLCIVYFELGIFLYHTLGSRSNNFVSFFLCFFPGLWFLGGRTSLWPLFAVFQLGIHVFLIVKIGIVYTNLALATSSILFFSEGIHSLVAKRRRSVVEYTTGRFNLTAAIAFFYLFISAGFLAGSIPSLSNLKPGTEKLLSKMGLVPPISLLVDSDEQNLPLRSIEFEDAAIHHSYLEVK